MTVNKTGSKWLSIGLIGAGITALVATALMNLLFGLSQGATTQGQQLLGVSSIVIDVAGLVLFGLAAGALWKHHQWVPAVLVTVIVCGCAGYSIVSVMGFVASERVTISKAREAQSKAIADQKQADLDAAKERRDTQARLAKEQLKWLQGTTREAGGRRERKDMLEAASKVISDVGQTDQKAPQSDTKAQVIVVRPDGQAEILSEFTGLSLSQVQLTIMLWMSVLLIAIKASAFMLAGFVWPARASAEAIDAQLSGLTPSAPPPQPPAPGLSAPAMKALAAPVANPAGGPPPATSSTVAAAVNSAGQGRVQGQWQLLPGAEDSLRSMGFPVDGRMAGRPLRPRLKGKDLGLKFCTWAQAGGLHGDNRHADDDIDRLNLEFSRAYHCQQAPHKDLKEALDSLVSNKLVYKSRPVQPDGTRPVRWSIKPGKYPKADPKQQAQPDTDPAKEGRLIRPPFGEAPGPEPFWLPLAQHERMKRLHRTRRDKNHKQRWAQANRRAA